MSEHEDLADQLEEEADGLADDAERNADEAQSARDAVESAQEDAFTPAPLGDDDPAYPEPPESEDA